jgi:hypothetical protein
MTRTVVTTGTLPPRPQLVRIFVVMPGVALDKHEPCLAPAPYPQSGVQGRQRE